MATELFCKATKNGMQWFASKADCIDADLLISLVYSEPHWQPIPCPKFVLPISLHDVVQVSSLQDYWTAVQVFSRWWCGCGDASMMATVGMCFVSFAYSPHLRLGWNMIYANLVGASSSFACLWWQSSDGHNKLSELEKLKSWHFISLCFSTPSAYSNWLRLSPPLSA